MSGYDYLVANKCEELLEDLRRQLAELRTRGSAIDGDMASLSALEERKNIIQQLKQLKTKLGDIMHSVDIELSSVKFQQDNDKRNILGSIGSYTKKPSKARMEWDKLANIYLTADKNITQSVPIIGDLSIDAIVCDSLNDVKADGNLYYITYINHFAIIIGGQLLHGNIGHIYCDTSTPEKIKDCKFRDGCNKRNQCDYYHDPLLFAGSRDIRNFVATSWTYCRGAAGKAKTVRRIGDREHLETDLAAITNEECDRFRDQVMHDILCNALIKKYGPRD